MIRTIKAVRILGRLPIKYDEKQFPMWKNIDMNAARTTWFREMHRGKDRCCRLFECYGSDRSRLRFMPEHYFDSFRPIRMLQQLRQNRIVRQLKEDGRVAHCIEYSSELKKERLRKTRRIASCGKKSCQICLLACAMKNMGCDVGHNVPYLCVDCYECRALLRYALKEVLCWYKVDDFDFVEMTKCGDVCFYRYLFGYRREDRL